MQVRRLTQVIYICHHPHGKRRNYGDLEWCLGCNDWRRPPFDQLWHSTVRRHEPDGPMWALDGTLVAFHWRH